MADIAAVFHWPPAAMESMDITELADWREHASRRSGAEE